MLRDSHGAPCPRSLPPPHEAPPSPNTLEGGQRVRPRWGRPRCPRNRMGKGDKVSPEHSGDKQTPAPHGSATASLSPCTGGHGSRAQHPRGPGRIPTQVRPRPAPEAGAGGDTGGRNQVWAQREKEVEVVSGVRPWGAHNEGGTRQHPAPQEGNRLQDGVKVPGADGAAGGGLGAPVPGCGELEGPGTSLKGDGRRRVPAPGWERGPGVS